MEREGGQAVGRSCGRLTGKAGWRSGAGKDVRTGLVRVRAGGLAELRVCGWACGHADALWEAGRFDRWPATQAFQKRHKYAMFGNILSMHVIG
ncbi:hypothetical protein DPMN_111963 [Dreissena polymorpha]|uniref:Uncharacterized protein n=1 Tax=Dreissena polymorpha TaxID=45954 RepID=A0A9D4KFE7_DREPO|nr:hypothetical protein DPMN_111963 [Dreissena polymorpha]